MVYHSRKLSLAELNYNIYDKELLAIVDAARSWQHYLNRSKYLVTVYSDYKNLTTYTTTKHLNRKQVH